MSTTAAKERGYASRRVVRWLSLVVLLLTSFYGTAQTHLPECTSNVPLFVIDLSSNPDSTYSTPGNVVREPMCCGISGNYVSFYVTMHPDVAAFEIYEDGAPAYGSAGYTIISGGDLTTPGVCGTRYPAGSSQCIVGPGPHKILYDKPGKNPKVYNFRQIPKPIFPDDQYTRVGCTKPINIYGLKDIVIRSINSSTGNTTVGAYNNLLSCTNCDNPVFTPGIATPEWIEYEVCGAQIASTVCGVYATCGTFRVYTSPALGLSVVPNPATFCAGGSVELEAFPSGGDSNYGFTWRDGNGVTVGGSAIYEAFAQGNYTVELSDGLNSPTCPSAFVTVPVSVGNTPIVNAGDDQTVCAQNPTAFLAGTITHSPTGIWSGGAGTFNPSNTSLATSYTPTQQEIEAGFVDLTLTSTGAGGGCLNTSDVVRINFQDSVKVEPIFIPITCNGGSTILQANASGGDGNFSYIWSTGASSDAINVTAGTYSVMVLDALGCGSGATVTVTQPDVLILQVVSTPTSYIGLVDQCTGTAEVIVSGGTPGYTYSWSPSGGTNQIASDLCYGVYSVTVTDANLCSTTVSTVVNNPTCSSFEANITSKEDVSCYGYADGEATVEFTGGVGPFTIAWNDPLNQDTETATGLSAGTYTVTITDANVPDACVAIATVTILQPTIITNVMTQTNVTTIGGNNGTATANPQGGTPGYTYLWDPTGQTTQTATGLTAGLYEVTITDSEGCEKVDQVLITQPPCNNFILAVNPTNVSCFGQSNGSASLTIAHGQPPYAITWYNSSMAVIATNVLSVSGLAAGSYSVEVTDNRACTAMRTFDITQPDQLSIGLDATNVTCFGLANGTIDLTVSGGTFPYSFQWFIGATPVATTEDLINLRPGTYSVTVTDANGCTISGTIGITQPTQIQASVSAVDVTCFGYADGSTLGLVSGGVTPYTYQWTGPGSFSVNTLSATNLEPGLYSFQITDANLCNLPNALQIFVNEPDLLVATPTLEQEVSCNGEADGEVSLAVTGGNDSYSYAWTGPSFTSTQANISGLAAGLYQITVTDNLGCQAIETINVTTVPDVTDPEVFCIATNPVVTTDEDHCFYTVNTTAWDATATDNCVVVSLTAELEFGGVVVASGLTTLNGVAFQLGTTTVTWTATDGLSNTASCSFDVTVEDDQAPSFVSCFASAQTVDTDLNECTYTMTTNAWNATATDNCTTVTLGYVLTGATTGSGTTLNGVTFNLGTTTVTWTATDGSSNTETCVFDVVVEDNQLPSFVSCIGSTQTVETDLNECTYTMTTNAWNATATDNCTTVTLGYVLTGATTGSGTTLNGVTFNLGTTTVTWTATDGSSNTETCVFDVVVEDNQLPSFVSCIGSTQTVETDLNECTYTMTTNAWNATATDNCTTVTLGYVLTGATTGSGTTLNGVTFNLGTTTVTWTATDGSSNTETCVFDVVVEDNQLPSFVACVGSTQTVDTDLNECTYTMTTNAWNATATDNCTTVTLGYVLTGATTGSGTTLNGVTFNLGTTTVTWTATDGSSNTETCVFDVVVEDNQLPSFVSCIGSTQTVETDLNECTYTMTTNAWNATATDNCTTVTLGYVLTGATTGSGTTLNGVTFNLGTTTVTWTATDGSSNTETCVFDVVVEDNQLPEIIGCLSDFSANNDATSCGAIVTWNVPTFTDNCTGASMTASHTPGDYFIVGSTEVVYVVTDGSGNQEQCSFFITVLDIEAPMITCPAPEGTCVPLVTYAAPVATDNCGVATIEMTAGLASGSVFPVGITPVTYLVTDIHGNENTCSFNVEVYPLPVLTLSPIDVSCNGFGDGSIELTVTNGTPDYTYLWSNEETTQNVSGLEPGVYGVTVVDANGCSGSAQATINQPLPLAINGVVTHATCFGGNNGSVNVTVEGGIAPYSYVWSNEETTEDVTGLTAGTYSVVVTDQNGCTIGFEGTVAQPTQLVITYSVNNAACNAPNGSVQTIVTGGVGPYSYAWSNESTGQNLINVVAGDYSLVVTDANGCTAQIEVSIASEATMNASVLVTNVTCYGRDNGGARVVVLNGNQPFTYLWSNGAETSEVTGLGAGEHSVTVTDAYGCSIDLLFEITQPEELLVNLSSPVYLGGYNVTPWGASNGSIETDVDGGTSPYTYLWSNGQTTPTISGMPAGNYSVVVTDENGCVALAQLALTQPYILEMPTGISPNGDGKNDYFVVHGIDAYPENEITIFNRWGNVVYQKNNYANEWDGTNTAGEPLPDATYFVILNVQGADGTITLKGYVDLRR
jgi:gliding motility-associated-like protein